MKTFEKLNIQLQLLNISKKYKGTPIINCNWHISSLLVKI